MLFSKSKNQENIYIWDKMYIFSNKKIKNLKKKYNFIPHSEHPRYTKKDKSSRRPTNRI